MPDFNFNRGIPEAPRLILLWRPSLPGQVQFGILSFRRGYRALALSLRCPIAQQTPPLLPDLKMAPTGVPTTLCYYPGAKLDSDQNSILTPIRPTHPVIEPVNFHPTVET